MPTDPLADLAEQLQRMMTGDRPAQERAALQRAAVLARRLNQLKRDIAQASVDDDEELDRLGLALLSIFGLQPKCAEKRI